MSPNQEKFEKIINVWLEKAQTLLKSTSCSILGTFWAFKKLLKV